MYIGFSQRRKPTKSTLKFSKNNDRICFKNDNLDQN